MRHFFRHGYEGLRRLIFENRTTWVSLCGKAEESPDGNSPREVDCPACLLAMREAWAKREEDTRGCPRCGWCGALLFSAGMPGIPCERCTGAVGREKVEGGAWSYQWLKATVGAIGRLPSPVDFRWAREAYFFGCAESLPQALRHVELLS